MKYFSILFFALALICPLIFIWTTGSVLLVILLITLGAFSLRKHYKNISVSESKQSLAGDVNWERHNKKPDETDMLLSKIEPFFRYGVPAVIIIAFIAGMRAQIFVLAILYVFFLRQNHK